jgi:hypothetical protein
MKFYIKENKKAVKTAAKRTEEDTGGKVTSNRARKVCQDRAFGSVL